MSARSCWWSLLQRRPALIGCLLLIALLLPACRRSRSVAPSAPPPTPPTQAVSAAPALGLPPAPVAASSGPRTPQHGELFNAFYRFVNDKGRVPRDVEELVNTRYLAPLPPPPAGKKYQLNNQSMELSVVDK